MQREEEVGGALCFLLPMPQQARLYASAVAFSLFSHPVTLSHRFSMHQGKTQLLLSSQQHGTDAPGLPEAGSRRRVGNTEHVVCAEHALKLTEMLPAGSSQHVGGEPQQGTGCPGPCSISPLREETTALGCAPMGAVSSGKQRRKGQAERKQVSLSQCSE